MVLGAKARGTVGVGGFALPVLSRNEPKPAMHIAGDLVGKTNFSDGIINT